MLPGRFTRRRAAAALLVAGSVLGVGWVAYRAMANPWPARAALQIDDEWPLAFTPDGQSFATSGAGRISVRDWATGAVRSSWPIAKGRIGVRGAFSPDGRTFAVATRGNRQTVLVELIDLATGRIRATGAAHYPQLGGFGFTPDGSSVLMGASDASGVREVVSFDVLTGAVEFACPPAPPAGTGQAVTSLDGRFLIYFDANGGAISIEEVGPAATRSTPVATGLTSAKASGAVDCSPDGRMLAVGRLDGTIDLWDIPGRRLIRTLPHPRGDLPPMFGPDPSKGPLSSRPGSPAGWALFLGLGPDGRTLSALYANADEPLTSRLLNGSKRLLGRPVTPSKSELLILDCATGRRLAGSTAAGYLDYSRDGRMVATHNHAERLVELREVPEN